MMNISYTTDALIVIDMQNDFGQPNGSLYVKDGETLVNSITTMCYRFSQVFFTQDAHPYGHLSFASSHSKNPFETIDMYGHPQVLWPAHCIPGTNGFEIVDGLKFVAESRARAIIRKGMNFRVDSYSAFRENFGPDGDRATTGFAGLLRELGIKRTFFVGLARDYCVRFSAEDAVVEGFESFVIDDLTKSVNPSYDAVAEVQTNLEKAGVKLIQYSDILPRI